MTVVLRPTVTALEDERAKLLAQTHLDEAELCRRSEMGRLTPEEASVLNRLSQIRFLLGEDD